MKIIWYFVVGLLVFGSLKIIYTKALPSWLGDVKVGTVTSVMVSLFLLYGAYIIWDELIRKKI